VKPPGRAAVSTWGRRAITIPAVVTRWSLLLLAAPVAFPVTAVLDIVQRRRLARTRALAMLLFYLSCEMVALTRSFVIWVRWRRSRDRFMAENFRLQCWWGRTLYHGAVRIFGLRVTVENDEVVAGGPVLVFARHVSPIDNLLPLAFISDPHQLRLRWVINRALLRMPCLDIVGNRLPNRFVSTGGRAGHTEKVSDLGDGLGPDEGVLIFPEGGLYSPAKRERVIERLRAAGETALAERADRIQNLLPPRLGGALALMERAEGADVLFMGHVGLQGAARYMSIAGGDLVGRELRIRFWRAPASEIPATREERVTWLYDWWERMDHWIANPDAGDPRGHPDCREDDGG
jgi:1-acyl-sn-glycerol-3-phosphate acyltransferase